MGAFDFLARALDLGLNRPRALVPWAALALVDLAAGLAGLGLGKGRLTSWPVPALVLLGLVDAVLLAWASATTLMLLQAAEKGENPALRTVALQGIRQTPTVLFLYLLLLLLFGGAVGLPGLIAALVAAASRGAAIALILLLVGWFLTLAVRVCLAEAACVVGRFSPSEALGRAWESSRGEFLSLLGLLVLLALVAFLLGLLGRIPGVGSLLSPLSAAASFYLATAALGYAYLHLRP